MTEFWDPFCGYYTQPLLEVNREIEKWSTENSVHNYASTTLHFERILGKLEGDRAGRLLILLESPSTPFPVQSCDSDPQDEGNGAFRYFCLTAGDWEMLRLEKLGPRPKWPSEFDNEAYWAAYARSLADLPYNGLIAFVLWRLMPAAAYVTNLFKSPKGRVPESFFAREFGYFRPTKVLSLTPTYVKTVEQLAQHLGNAFSLKEIRFDYSWHPTSRKSSAERSGRLKSALAALAD